MSTLALLAENDNSFIRTIQADQERTRAMLEPVMRQMAEFAKTVEKMNEPMQRLIESMQPSIQMAARLQESMRFTFPTHITSSLVEEPVIEMRREVTMSRTIELSEDVLDVLASKVAERIAERHAVAATNTTYRVLETPSALSRQQIVAIFEDGKRKKALTLLLRAKGWTKTAVLREILDCPTNDATRKVIAGVNERVRTGLGIVEDLIEPKRGSGYRINRTIPLRRD